MKTEPDSDIYTSINKCLKKKYFGEMRQQNGKTKFEIFSSADNINLHKNSHILFNIRSLEHKKIHQHIEHNFISCF